jgi:hypothetical protein
MRLCSGKFAFRCNVLKRFVMSASNSVASFTTRWLKYRQHDVSPTLSLATLTINEGLADLESALAHFRSLIFSRVLTFDW